MALGPAGGTDREQRAATFDRFGLAPHTRYSGRAVQVRAPQKVAVSAVETSAQTSRRLPSRAPLPGPCKVGGPFAAVTLGLAHAWLCHILRVAWCRICCARSFWSIDNSLCELVAAVARHFSKQECRCYAHL